MVTEALRHLVSCLSTMSLLLELYMWQCATVQTTHCLYEFEKAFMVERFLGNFATMHWLRIKARNGQQPVHGWKFRKTRFLKWLAQFNFIWVVCHSCNHLRGLSWFLFYNIPGVLLYPQEMLGAGPLFPSFAALVFAYANIYSSAFVVECTNVHICPLLV